MVGFLLFSNSWVALCVSVLVLGLAHYYCIDDCLLYALFAFSGTFATYNFHRLVRNRTFQKAAIITDRSRWQSRHRVFLLIACAAAILTAVILFFFLPFKLLSLVLLGIAGLVVLFYAIPFPFSRKALRDLSGLKNTWIAAVWVILVSIPLINREKAIAYSDLTLIAAFIYIQIIPFDIRDISYDPRTMKTLPQQLGIKGSRFAATLLLLICGAFMAAAYPFNWFFPLTLLISLGGLWWTQGASVNRYLELFWDGALLSLGLFYYTLSCMQR
jgi:1,4-dihydroxy-2-naphthoate octaprenyltransferase